LLGWSQNDILVARGRPGCHFVTNLTKHVLHESFSQRLCIIDNKHINKKPGVTYLEG
jgi:hypothetical protein